MIPGFENVNEQLDALTVRGDLISRQAAIDAIDGLPNCYNGYSDTYDKACIIGVLEELPSAQTEQRWIPCSERLPDLWNERYLVSLAWGGVGTMEYKSTGFHNYGSFSPVPIETVTAWMPLPEPYKGAKMEGER